MDRSPGDILIDAGHRHWGRKMKVVITSPYGRHTYSLLLSALIAIIPPVLAQPGQIPVSTGKTLLRRAFPPFLQACPTLLVPLGSTDRPRDNLLGISCTDGSFYIISPAANRYFISRSRITDSGLEAAVPFLSRRHNDSYFLGTAAQQLYLLHWNGVAVTVVAREGGQDGARRARGGPGRPGEESSLPQRRGTTDRPQPQPVGNSSSAPPQTQLLKPLRLAPGPSISIALAWESRNLYLIEATGSPRPALARKLMLSADTPLLDAVYCPASDLIVARTTAELISIDLSGRIRASSPAPSDPSPPFFPPSEFSALLTGASARRAEEGALAEVGGSSLYAYGAYSGADSSWLLRAFLIDDGTVEPAWEMKMPGRVWDLETHAGELFVAAGEVELAAMSPNSFIYEIDMVRGEITNRRRLYQPAVFLADWDGGIAALCFRLDLILFDYHLEQLSIDHETMFPIALLATDLDNDGTKDLMAAGVRHYTLPPAVKELIAAEADPQYTPSRMGGSYSFEARFAVDCFINDHSRILAEAREEMDRAREALASRLYRSAWNHYARARGDLAVLKKKDRVAQLNGLLARVRRSEQFSSHLPQFLILALLLGLLLGALSRQHPAFKLILGMLLVGAPPVLFRIFSPVAYFPAGAYALGFLGALSLVHLHSSLAASRAADLFGRINTHREIFSHGGGGSMILGSLKLLLANADSMKGREDELKDLLSQRLSAFRETCQPRLKELGTLVMQLPFFRPEHIDVTSHLDRCCLRVQELVESDKLRAAQCEIAYREIKECESQLRDLFEWLKRYPACDVALVTRQVWKHHPLASDPRFHLYLAARTGESIAFLPEMELRFILENLFTNAGRYLEQVAEPQLEIKVNRSRGRLIIYYRDNGPGLSSEQIKRITRSVRDTEGHGRGLALSLEKVRQYGGSLDLVPSTRGARIKIALLSFGARRNARYVQAFAVDSR